MNVKLISITRSMIDEVHEARTAEPLIVYIARVSNPSNQANMLTGTKLISYLIENRHWSPFEMVHMTVEIKTSRAIAQQILRHRSFSFQEFSQRYAVATKFETYPARRQDVKNRQNSIDDMDEDTKVWFDAAQGAVDKVSSEYYKEALAKGIAKEQARFLLPLSTSTTIYMSGSVRSWIHYLQLRTEKGTQLEHREIAEGIRSIFRENFPDTNRALGWVTA